MDVSGSVDRIRNILAAARSRLWLIPAAMTFLAAALARLLVSLDEAEVLHELDAWWYFGGDVETARGLLSVLLSGMLTMASLVISINLVVLTLAANQLGPRLIWNFIGDRQIQGVIGLFFGTIFYILVTLRSTGADAVPDLSVTVSTVLVGLCLFALLFHVHKLARSIVADTVVDEVAESLLKAIDGLGHVRNEEHPEAPFPEGGHPLAIGRAGYIQVVEYKRLLAVAEKRRIRIAVRVRAGQFVLAAGEHVRILAALEPDEETAEAIRGAFIIGAQRTPTQDLEYSVRQLVEVAVRALSPGINDPFTAIAVVHRLGAAVERVLEKGTRDRIACVDEEGTVRVVGVTSTFEGLVDAAFNQIRQAAEGGQAMAVLIALADMVGQLLARAAGEEERAVLTVHLQKIERAARRATTEREDLHDFNAIAGGALAGRPVDPATPGPRPGSRSSSSE